MPLACIGLPLILPSKPDGIVSEYYVANVRLSSYNECAVHMFCTRLRSGILDDGNLMQYHHV